MDRELSDEVLDELATEDALHDQFCQLSLNGITSSDTTTCIKLKTKVKGKVMLVLIDSGNTHSFINSQFVHMAGIPTVPMMPMRVKLANGQEIVIDQQVANLQWYCQGHTLSSNMVVLDMHPYDAILGFDWLQAHSPTQCDWERKTLQFSEAGKPVKLQGLQAPALQLSQMSAKKVYNPTRGNDVWAFVLLDYVPDTLSTTSQIASDPPPQIQNLLTTYADVFAKPKNLPPQRTYDHTIPLIPRAIPINSRPYHYSPHHKNEIERQVQ